MGSERVQMVHAAAQICTAALAATAETGARALRAAAAESAQVAQDATAAFRAPQTDRAAAFESVLLSARESQRRQVHAMRGMATLWSMAFLRGMDAARRQHRQ